ncbi:MAG: uroporphyrinogen decarboxylase family protein [Anaerolineae bacterium]
MPVTLAYGHIDELCLRRGHPEMVARLRQDQKTVSFASRAVPRALFSGYLADCPPEATISEWGVASVRSSTGASTAYIHPLASMTTASELACFPFPDMQENWRHHDLEGQVAEVHSDGVAAVGQMSQTIFELAWAMRGMAALLTDFSLDRSFAATLLDRLTEVRCFQAKRFVEAGVDVLRLGDDIGTERGLLMSPAMWREWLKPGLQRVIESARSVDPSIPIKYHSDGNVEAVIHDLIEVGVSILNPVQPECMDPVRLKQEYGHHLAFWGTIGVQSTMPFGSPADVRLVVRRMVETVGDGGGLVLAPTHSIEDDVPWENVLAFYEAAEEYGACG